MGLTKPLTAKQLQANRENAKKSTGPKSESGKHNSSQNAIAHGFLARSVILPGESSERFHALLASYISAFQPDSQAEYDLVETMAVCRWRILRSWTFESSNIAHEQRQQAGSNAHEDLPTQGALAVRTLDLPPRSLESLARHESRLDRTYHRAADRLRRIQAQREKKPERSHQLTENKQTPRKNEPKRTLNEAITNPEQSLDEAA